jgi:hypothetical protein
MFFDRAGMAGARKVSRFAASGVEPASSSNLLRRDGRCIRLRRR